MRNTRKFFSSVFLAVFLISCAHSPVAGTKKEQTDFSAKIRAIDPAYQHVTDEYSNVFRTIKALGNICTPSKVIVAFDIDNTILVNDNEFGSEQWFDWQASMLNDSSAIATEQKVASDFLGLLKADLKIREKSKMHLIEKGLDQKVRELQKQNFTFIALTSRGPDNKAATLREFRRNHLNFSKPAIHVGKDVIKNFPKPEMVDFQDNIFLTSGQNKGVMLKTLLTETKIKPCGVVFVDNKEKYSEQISAALADEDIITVTFRYSREDKTADEFRKKDKSEFAQAWKKIK